MNKTSIFIVGDDLSSAQALKRLLELQGYFIPNIAVPGLSIAFQIMKEQPDLALIDIGFKGNTNGIETAEFFIKKYGIPVIFTTYNTDEKILKKAEKVKPHGILIKPFQEKQLLDLIEKIIISDDRRVKSIDI